MQTGFLEFSEDDARAGYRLHRFELFNWGTFDQYVWRIEANGDNALLTGDIGSGKSTLVDGLTTLLVPQQKITYNKAAGAESRERSLNSYVRGFYKSAKEDDSFSARQVALRDQDSYSVLLAYFFNEGFASGVTLAQVFWLKDNKTQPERFYTISNQPLTIDEHFAGFGDNLLNLKKRLRNDSNCEVFDSFSKYSTEFRRRLSIESDQALELFYQTVSMKSVNNITQFVREHMLEAPVVQERIDHICTNFENLNQAHAAVVKAKEQIETLKPMVADCDKYALLEDEFRQLEQYREGLHAFFADKKTVLLRERIEQVDLELEKLNDRLLHEEERLDGLRQQQSDLQRSIDESGGRRLADIMREVERLQIDRHRKAELAERYQDFAAKLNLAPADDANVFYANRMTAEKLATELTPEKERVAQQQVDLQIEARHMEQQEQEVARELESLSARQSNIPSKNLQIRAELCATIGLDETRLPFVGELLHVREEAVEWEGAVERLLHSFGLSLLTPDEYYHKVARYVDRTDLRGRLVYFRVEKGRRLAASRPTDAEGAALVQKLEVKPGHEFEEWLRQELVQRFDYVCCESLEEFQRQPRAITRQGQVKSNRVRHEKDDRHRLDDRSRYVLGWSNESKINTLKLQQRQFMCQIKSLQEKITGLRNQLGNLEEQKVILRLLLDIKDFNDIHWQDLAVQIDQLLAEKKEIEQGSEILRTLRNRLEDVDRQAAASENKLTTIRREQGKHEQRLEDSKLTLGDAEEIRDTLTPEEQKNIFPSLLPMLQSALGEVKLTVENCDKNQTRMREWLQQKLNNSSERSKRLTERIIRQMQSYKGIYPRETSEVDVGLESADDFRQMLAVLTDEDLPRHEKKFKTLLKEGAINDIALFQNQLEKEREAIREKIGRINRSLHQIEYNPGSYIKLICEDVVDQEIRTFRQDLRACLGGTLADSEDELYTEQKFLQVKKLIDRFKGREGLSDLDLRWKRKVTDVRNWFEFSASERWLEDDKEREFYSDSAGKSGGQKEKLAYTVLASALAYQFGLEWGEIRSRTFRFVMIDEAFGRGSDESARYALELFRKLNLQLLIVTPMQKTHVIEPYVRSLHFVYNHDGRKSLLRNVSIEVYRAEKQKARHSGNGDGVLSEGVDLPDVESTRETS